MGLSASQRERLQEIAQEAKEIVGGCLHPDGRPMTFAELEDECIEAGDLLTAAMLQATGRGAAAAPGGSLLSDLRSTGRAGPDEPRVLQTDRGEVSWMEPSLLLSPLSAIFFSLARLNWAWPLKTRSARECWPRWFTRELRPPVSPRQARTWRTWPIFRSATSECGVLAVVLGAIGSMQHQRLQEAFQSKPLPEQSSTANRPTSRLPRSLA